MRQIERWLHQHIFKVGWLLTHNFETTTILYYTVFLPGVLLHEVIYWLMAGVMNVRAERSIQWPEKQEIGELELNFIKLAPKAHPIKRAIISATPLIAGLLAIWVIAVNIFQLEDVMSLASSGQLEDVSTAINFLFSAPDFWIWFYISFTIANTMFPTIRKDMKGWWQIGGGVAVIIVTLLIFGIGQSFLEDVSLSVVQFLNSLSAILILIIGINITMVMILGLIEYTIERATGHSATFQKGKMITMTREEALQRKQEEQEKRLAARSRSRRRVATADPASIYTFEFPIPGPPGQEPITKGVAAVLGMDDIGELPDTVEEDDVIETTATDSTRQRMLKLFPDAKTQSQDENTDDEQLALPDGKSEVEEPKPEIAKPRPKPTFNVRSFAEPEESQSESDSDDIEELEDNKSSVVSSASKPVKDVLSEEIPHKAVDNKPQTETLKQTTKQQPEHDNSSQNDEGKPKTASHPLKTVASQAIDLSSLKKPVDGDDSQSKDEKKESTESQVDNVADQPRTQQPEVAHSGDEIDEIADEEEKDEQPTRLRPRPTSRFTGFDDDSSSELDEDTEDEDETSDVLTDSRSPFSRPFVKRDEALPDEDEDDETIESEEPSFPRPFASNDTKSKSAPSWRSQLTRPSVEQEDVDDEDEDDEQLGSRLPRRTSMFDSLNKSDDKQSSDTPSWRSQLSSSSHDDEEDEDDESLTPSRPRTSSMFDSKPKTDDKSSLPNDWRDKLTQSTSSDEEDEGDEQLGSRLPRRTSMFDSLNKSEDEQSSDTPSWRSQLSSPPHNDEEDEGDESLTPSRPRTSSMFDSKPKTGDKSSLPNDWRNKLTQSTSSDEEDEGDEQLGSRLPRRTSMFDSLNKPDDKQSSDTPSWRSQLSSPSHNDEKDEDDESLTPSRPRTSSMFDSKPKTGDKSSLPNDWRNKLTQSTSSDEEDEDDEQLASRLPRRTSMFDSLNKSEDEQSSDTPSWRSQLTRPTIENDDDDDEQLGGKSILSGLGRPQSNLPRTTSTSRGSRPAPKPTSDWRSQLEKNDEADDDVDDIIYEPLEDEIIYEDDDEYDFYDDDDNFYDDDS